MKPGTALALAGLAALLLSSGGGGSVPHRGPVVPSSGLPENYSAEKLPMLRRRYDDAGIRAAVERWRDRMFPGVPTTAMIAAGASSTGASERGGPPDYATGLWGVEWSRVERWARDERTMRELGRAIPTEPSAFAHDYEAQAYVSFRSYLAHLTACVADIPGELAPRAGSPFLWRLAVSSYSSGEGTVSRIVSASAGRIVAAPPSSSWRELAQGVIAAAAAGHSTYGGISIAGKWKAAHTIVRNEQRFQCGMMLAQHVAPAELEWYADGWLAPETSRELARLAG